jgi:hypothetical protein
VLQFLIQSGLVIEEAGKLRTGEFRIHLGNDSPMVFRSHSNWRMQAIQAL